MDEVGRFLVKKKLLGKCYAVRNVRNVTVTSERRPKSGAKK